MLVNAGRLLVNAVGEGQQLDGLKVFGERYLSADFQFLLIWPSKPL